jgi:hypothetical protein
MPTQGVQVTSLTEEIFELLEINNHLLSFDMTWATHKMKKLRGRHKDRQ